MNRRTMLQVLLAAPALAAATAALAKPETRPLLLQESPLAGFQYHQGRRLWHRLRVGQPLRLVREPRNRFDRRAVALYWRGHKLGYLPRTENRVAASLLDQQQPLVARITRLRASDDPWQRVRVGVEMTAPNHR